MTSLGYASVGPGDYFAGIAVDDANDIVYTVYRATDDLYAFDWNPAGPNVTLKAGYPIDLPNCSAAYGIALDEKTDTLWVADYSSGVARAYDTTTWTEDTNKSYKPSAGPMDVAVDRLRGFVYTTNCWAGSPILSKYDLATSTETTVNLSCDSVGVAVDELTGCVYVTISPYCSYPYIGELQIWDTSTSPWTQVDVYNVSGSPAGICIPQEEVAYNPLNLTKDDGLADDECVVAGGSITYDICYDNLANAYNVSNVTIADNLPTEVSFASATGGGTYDSSVHTVTWNIGTLLAGAAQQCVQLVVDVNTTAAPGSTITNSATIDSDETPPTTVNEDTDVCLNQPPNVSDAYPSIDCLWPPNHKFVDITIEGVTDPDGDEVTITITNITSDEPTATIEGAGGAEHAPDAGGGVGTETASVRAERSGDGNGRVYEITFVASDGIAETVGNVTVCVPHDKSDACECVNDGQIYDATGIN
jgi:uncharacterized repeat protein (TIGR01451 family)